MKIVFTPRLLQYRAKTSAESTEPIRLPKCGVLFTKGRADVMSTLRLPGSGSIGGLAMLEETIERQPRRELKVWKFGESRNESANHHVFSDRRFFRAPKKRTFHGRHQVAGGNNILSGVMP